MLIPTEQRLDRQMPETEGNLIRIAMVTTSEPGTNSRLKNEPERRPKSPQPVRQSLGLMNTACHLMIAAASAYNQTLARPSFSDAVMD